MLLALAHQANSDCSTPEGGCSSDSDCAECCICVKSSGKDKGYCMPDPNKELPPNTPSTGEECCGGEPVPEGWMCCNGEIYNPENQSCCNGKVTVKIECTECEECRPLEDGQATCDPKQDGDSCNDGHCCGGECIANDRECCGGTPFNPDEEKCCNGTPISKDAICCHDTPELCCGDTPKEYPEQECCGNQPITKSDTQDCCGNTVPYNPQETLCCEDQHYPQHHPEEYICCFDTTEQKIIPVLHSECCEGIRHNPACCNGVPLLSGMKCCDGEPIPENDICCHDTPHLCCGNIPRDYPGQECCGDKPLKDGMLCCRDTEYDPSIEGCCGGKLPYNLTTDICCDDGEAYFNVIAKCCGDDVIGKDEVCCLTEPHLCCGNNPKKYPRLKNFEECCGDIPYIIELYDCCRGLDFKRRPVLKKDCCNGNEVPPDMVCCDKTDNSIKESKIDCCYGYWEESIEVGEWRNTSRKLNIDYTQVSSGLYTVFFDLNSNLTLEYEANATLVCFCKEYVIKREQDGVVKYTTKGHLSMLPNPLIFNWSLPKSVPWAFARSKAKNTTKAILDGLGNALEHEVESKRPKKGTLPIGWYWVGEKLECEK